MPYEEVSASEKKAILKKLIGYCIPFIIINVANSIYNTVDMILVIKGLNWIGYPAGDIETISSVFTTWGSKLVSVVTAIATGLVISLIPTIVESYTKKDMKEVNSQFNKTLQVLLYVILPLSIFLSIKAPILLLKSILGIGKDLSALSVSALKVLNFVSFAIFNTSFSIFSSNSL